MQDRSATKQQNKHGKFLATAQQTSYHQLACVLATSNDVAFSTIVDVEEHRVAWVAGNV
jgi:hypothetical protein